MSSSTSISDSLARPGRRAAAFLLMLAGGAAVAVALFVVAVALGLRDATMLRETKQAIEFKLAPLEAPGRPPYLVVVAGSNAAYSIDSPALRRLTGLPVANLAIQWSYTAYVFDRAIPDLRPGDVILLPLEYEYFSSLEGRSQLEACYLIMEDRRPLASARAFLSAMWDCSPMLMMDGLVYRTAVAFGMHERVFDPRDQLTPEGDMRENAAGANHWRGAVPIAQVPEDRAFGNPRFASLIRAALARGARVFLSYPVRPQRDDGRAVVSADWVPHFEAWAAAVGVPVISTPEAHVFPADCFFDSPYHLHRGCTAANSERYAAALRPYLH